MKCREEKGQLSAGHLQDRQRDLELPTGECPLFALAPRPIIERKGWDGHPTRRQPVLS